MDREQVKEILSDPASTFDQKRNAVRLYSYGQIADRVVEELTNLRINNTKSNENTKRLLGISNANR
jgi:hypothetical protein